MGGAAVRRGHPLYETAEGAEFACACRRLFAEMRRVSAAEFREAVACAAADPCFGPLRHVAFEWAAADDCGAAVRCGSVSCVRFQQEVKERHGALYEQYVGGATPYKGQWHVFVQEHSGFGADGCCRGAGGAESRLERCGGGEPCPGAHLAAGLTKTARDASKWLSRCDGSEMVCQMSRSQLRVFLARALQCLRLTCESCERDAPEEGVSPVAWAAGSVEADVARRCGAAVAATYRHEPYVRVCDPSASSSWEDTWADASCGPLRSDTSLAPACGAVYGLEGKASGSEAATRDLRACLSHFERWAARLRAQAFLFCFLDFTAEGAEFACACRRLFAEMRRVSAAEFREAVVCAAADPCFGPLRHVAFEWAAADDCAGPRFQQEVKERHGALYEQYVGGATPYKGSGMCFSEGLGLRCYTYGPKEYAAAPSLAVHIAANELRCCDGGAAGALAVWRDAVVGYGLRRIHLAAGRLGLMDAAGGAGGAESRLERCGGGEPCPGAHLAAGLTKTARDASKWLSRCDGSEMVCQMSRSQLRVFLARALHVMRRRRACRPSRGLLCGAAPLPPAGWGAEGSVEADVARRCGAAVAATYRHEPYVRVCDPSASSSWEDTWADASCGPLRSDTSLAPACGAVYGLEGKASGSEAATRDLRACLGHFERWAARLRAQAFLRRKALARACRRLFAEMRRVSAAEFREAVVCAAADPCFGPLRHVAFEWAAADDCAGPRFQEVKERHGALYEQYVGGATPYKGSGTCLSAKDSGFGVTRTGRKSTRRHRAWRCTLRRTSCGAATAVRLARWRCGATPLWGNTCGASTLRLGGLCVRASSLPVPVLRVARADGCCRAGGAESRLERCGGGEPCPGADLAAGLTKTARDASKWLSRCDGSEMVCQMSRSQLRVFLARALQCLRLTCESCERDAPEEGVSPVAWVLCGAPRCPAGWGAEGSVEADVARRCGAAVAATYRHEPYVRVCDPSASSSWEDTWADASCGPLRSDTSLAPACGAVYGLEGRRAGLRRRRGT
eukprot:gene6413-4620_t